MTRTLSAAAAACACLGLATTNAVAAPQIFFGENLTPGGAVSGDPVTARNDFLGNLSGVGTEDFEGFTLGSSEPLSLGFPGSSGSISATLSGGDATIDNGGSGRYATSGSQYVETEGGGDFSINFSDPVAAFGFFGTDVGDFGGELLLELTSGAGSSDISVGNTVNAPDSSLLFFGVIDQSNPFTSIAFENTSGSDFFGFDDMTVGDVGQVEPPAEVPVASSVTLFGGGLIGMLAASGVGRRFRREGVC